MSEDFNTFRRRVLKLSEKRNHKIKNSIGIKEALSWCRNNNMFKKRVSNLEFCKIIRTVNNLMASELLESRDVKFPQQMGQLEVRKFPIYVKFVDGELKTNRKVDWKATLELWRTDDEARESKLIVKHEDTERFKIYYNKVVACYNNKTLMQFKPNRELIIAINKKAKEGLIDAFGIGI